MQEVIFKQLPYIKKASLLCLVMLTVCPSVVSSQESYRFERMWPTLTQPWYFNSPQGIAIAPDGSVYIADSKFFRIQKFTQDGLFINRWGREGIGNGEFGACDDQCFFPSGPRDIAVASDGTLYVADTHNHRIQKFTAEGVYLNQWGEYGDGEGQFKLPSGVAVDTSGFVYISDYENHRLQKFSSDGIFITAWGTKGSESSQFDSPSDVAVDTSGNVYVTDEKNNRIQKFTPNGTFILKWDSATLGEAQFASPEAITFDANNNSYVINSGFIYDENEFPRWAGIYKIDPNGRLIDIWRNLGFGEDGFQSPSGIAIHANGYVYVTDTDHNRIKKLSLDGEVVNIWASYEMGDDLFHRPEGIAVGNNGTIYVTDPTRHCIHTFTPDGTHTTWGEEGSNPGEFNNPRGIALDDSGNLYICDNGNNRIQKFTHDGHFVTMWGSDDDLPLLPYGIALDSRRNVYVTDLTSELNPVGGHIFHHRIQKFKPNATGTAYQFDIMWNTWGNKETFYNIYGIAIGCDGSGVECVYVAEWTDPSVSEIYYVHKFTLDGQYVATWTEAAAGDAFNQPTGVAADENGHVYIADSGNCRVLKFDTEGVLITSFGTLGSGPGQLNGFHNLAVGDDESVYVSDTLNNRIQVFTKVESVENSKAVIVAGGGPYDGNNLWDATQMTASFAYRALNHQGFAKNDIYYLSANADLDLDSNGISDDIYNVPSTSHLYTALSDAVGEHVENLVLYLTDHGGVDQSGSGIFRMSESETLSSFALSSLLDEFQASIPGRITVIIDACQSGSFMKDGLWGGNRIIITSSASDEQAKFLNQGTISFSHFFWSHIFNGASLESAFFDAGNAINFVIANQTPQMRGDTENVYIGNGTENTVGEAPVIGGEVTSSRGELTIETSAVLSVDDVVDPNNDAITRVWAVIWPPDYETGSIEDPLVDLPTVDLQPAGGNSYAAPYNEFHAIGLYQVAVYAMDEHGNTSLPQFTVIPKRVSRRAIILAGGEGPGISRRMIEHNAGLAYNTLRSQHYGIDDIYLMSSTTFFVEEDDEVIINLPTREFFEGYLEHLGSDGSVANLDLTIYLIGASEDGDFVLNDDPDEYETLSAAQLDEWLDDLQAAKPGRVTVICDADGAGAFIRKHSLPEGSQHITISSTGDESAAYFNSEGNISFSSFLWDQLAAGATVGNAFIYARKAIAYCSIPHDISFSCYRPQSPLIDANGNGMPNETADYDLVREIKIGDGMVTADDPPRIGSVSVVREGEMITVTAEEISSTSPIERVWAIINPLLYCPGTSEGIPQEVTEIELQGPDEAGRYAYTYTAPYACKVTVYAMNYDAEGEPNISLPLEARIYQEEGGDIYEPDNDASESNVIVVNHPTPQPHTFHTIDDEDWVEFYGVAKGAYTIEASNLGGNCPVIELYDGDDVTKLIAEPADQPVDGKVWIDFRCTKSSTYYVRLVCGGTCAWVDGKMHYDLTVFDDNQGVTGIVRGRVKDRITGKPIDGAVIRSDGVGHTKSSNGQYILSEIPGDFTLTATKEGYVTSRTRISIESVDQQIRKDIAMQAWNRSCSEDADCDDWRFCNGRETCVGGVCQAGTYPCTGAMPACDEEQDMCAEEEEATIQLLPNTVLQSGWMPLPIFLRIVGTNTHFDSSSTVTFDPPGAVMALLVRGDSTHLFMIGLVMPSWRASFESVEVTVSTPTRAEVVSEKVDLQLLLLPNVSP